MGVCEGLGHLGRGLVALVGLVGHGALDHGPEGPGHVIPQLLRAWRGGDPPGPDPRQDGVQGRPHRVDVGPVVDAPGVDPLFGRHVAPRAQHAARVRGVPGVPTQGPPDAEVHHLGGAIEGQHDVAGVHVPVDHALGVGVVQGVEDLLQDGGRVAGRDGPPQLDDLLQRPAQNELHDDEQLPVGLTGVVDLRHVGVGQLRRHGRLAKEAPAHRLVDGHGRGEHLDGALPLLPTVEGPVDRGRRPHAELAEELVAVVSQGGGHGHPGGLSLRRGAYRLGARAPIIRRTPFLLRRCTGGSAGGRAKPACRTNTLSRIVGAEDLGPEPPPLGLHPDQHGGEGVHLVGPGQREVVHRRRRREGLRQLDPRGSPPCSRSRPPPPERPAPTPRWS